MLVSLTLFCGMCSLIIGGYYKRVLGSVQEGSPFLRAIDKFYGGHVGG